MALKRLVIIAALLLGFVGQASAVSYIKFEQVTIDNTTGGVGFTHNNISSTDSSGNSTGHTNAQWALCQLTGAEISYTYDGTAPTSSSGVFLEVNQPLTLYSNMAIINFRAIRTGSSNGTLRCHYTD